MVIWTTIQDFKHEKIPEMIEKLFQESVNEYTAKYVMFHNVSTDEIKEVVAKTIEGVKVEKESISEISGDLSTHLDYMIKLYHICMLTKNGAF